jgi:membrane dipeptidase
MERSFADRARRNARRISSRAARRDDCRSGEVDRAETAARSETEIDWLSIESGDADRWDGRAVAISGWLVPVDGAAESRYFLFVAEAPCCAGCLPGDPSTCIEVMTARPVPASVRCADLVGTWRRLIDDSAGWRYRLADAAEESSTLQRRPACPRVYRPVTRRDFLASAAAVALSACAAPAVNDERAKVAPQAAVRPPSWLARSPTVDMHSHSGRVIAAPKGAAERPFLPFAGSMRDGGMNIVCLAIVTDTYTTHVTPDRRIEAYRTPEPGELYGLSQIEFGRVRGLIERESLRVVTDAASFRAAREGHPAVIVASEGADFLEGQIDRVDEAWRDHHLRHLQLTHYRVNELGDIQTAAPVHNGLTDFGAEVIRRCNKLGIVVDVAHGTLALVKRAARESSLPLILSHTSLNPAPRPRSRTIGVEHARLIADTEGVIGVWPPTSIYPDLDAMARGMRELALAVGVEHVGLGSDMLGLLVPSAFATYRHLPLLADALVRAGFKPDEASLILGGNYARVFEHVLSAAAA